jgi:hypothetical protein
MPNDLQGFCGQGGYYCSGPDCQFQYGPACDANTIPTSYTSDPSKTPRTLIGNLPYGATIASCSEPGVVALTFDDGPYSFTEELLDYLKSVNVNATFFISGNNGAKGDIGDPANGYYAMVQRMITDVSTLTTRTTGSFRLDSYLYTSGTPSRTTHLDTSRSRCYWTDLPAAADSIQ